MDSEDWFKIIITVFVTNLITIIFTSAYCHSTYRGEIISRGAAHYEVNDKGEVKFVWDTQAKKE